MALSDPSRTFSSPHENYTRQSKDRDLAYFQKLVEDESIALFVVGLPIHLDGRESQKSKEARNFAKWLGNGTKRPVALFDERFTSAQAEQMLMGANFTKKKRKQRMDMLAAQILLAAFLDAGCPMDADRNEGLDDST